MINTLIDNSVIGCFNRLCSIVDLSSELRDEIRNAAWIVVDSVSLNFNMLSKGVISGRIECSS